MARNGLSVEMLVAVAASLGFHGLWLSRDAKASLLAHDPVPTDLFIESEPRHVEPPPPPPAPPEEPKAEPENKPVPVQKSAPASAKAAAAAAPPPAARAGSTLTAPDDGKDSEVADFTMVQGQGTSYAGGTTSALGTSTSAVRGAASDGPAPERRAPVVAPAAAGPDRSRGTKPANGDWSCSHLYPKDPDAPDRATVLISVTVSSNGTPRSVSVLRDPGFGFGAAARACALSQRYEPALDRLGSPITATTPPITVRFSR